MVEKKGRVADVIPFAPKPRPAGGSPLAEGPGKLVPCPPRPVAAAEATTMLSLSGRISVRPTALVELGAPKDLMLSLVDGGVEIFDSGSSRSRPFSPTDSDLGWVGSFYIGVYEDGGRIMCRYLNREPGRRALSSLEQPVHDPSSRMGKFTMDSFIESVIFGDEPD